MQVKPRSNRILIGQIIMNEWAVTPGNNMANPITKGTLQHKQPYMMTDDHDEEFNWMKKVN